MESSIRVQWLLALCTLYELSILTNSQPNIHTRIYTFGALTRVRVRMSVCMRVHCFRNGIDTIQCVVIVVHECEITRLTASFKPYHAEQREHSHQIGVCLRITGKQCCASQQRQRHGENPFEIDEHILGDWLTERYLIHTQPSC